MEVAAGQPVEQRGGHIGQHEADEAGDGEEPGLDAAAAEAGGVIAGASREVSDAFEAYGHNLGIAFQIVDDLLDFTGDAQAVGKPLASDLREGKVTLPLIHLLHQSADPRPRAIVDDIIASKSATPEAWQELLGHLTQHASIDYAYRRAVEYAERAKKPLQAFPPSAERDALAALPDYVVQRDR